MGISQRSELGRGALATRDMTARLAHLRAHNADVVSVLWERYLRAITGEGFSYEFADQRDE